MADSPQSSATCTVAAYPFNLDTADIILRTPDLVDFRVHRAILAIVSPVFATMFQLPQPGFLSGNGPDSTSLPVVDIAEDSKTLDALLRLCYPVPKKETEETDDIILALGAAIKYDMEWPVSVFTRKLEDLAYRNPLHTWTVSCRLGSETVARKAAASLLRDQKDATRRGLHTILGAEGWTTLEGVSAGNYHRLDEFLRQQGEVDADFLLLSPTFPEPAGMQSCAEPQDLLKLFVSNIPNPDVICRASDGVDFEVHRAILSLRSISFVKTPPSEESPKPEAAHSSQPPDEREPDERERAHTASDVKAPSDAHPILHFEGDAETLSIILAICYNSAPSNLNPSHLVKVIAACNQYEAGLKTVHRTAQQLWDEQARAQPLHAYFAATTHRLVPQARAAAKLTISHNSLGAARKYAPIMEDSPAHVYHKLLTYCLTCEHAVQLQLKTACSEWRNSDVFKESETYYPTNKKATYYIHTSFQTWLVQYLEQVEGKWDAEGQGVDWTSMMGSFALVEQAVTRRFPGTLVVICAHQHQCLVIKDILSVDGEAAQIGVKCKW
ncbi:hypothetical protein VTO73DRAFT_7422 [Trametes versicolor]